MSCTDPALSAPHTSENNGIMVSSMATRDGLCGGYGVLCWEAGSLRRSSCVYMIVHAAEVVHCGGYSNNFHKKIQRKESEGGVTRWSKIS